MSSTKVRGFPTIKRIDKSYRVQDCDNGWRVFIQENGQENWQHLVTLKSRLYMTQLWSQLKKGQPVDIDRIKSLDKAQNALGKAARDGEFGMKAPSTLQERLAKAKLVSPSTCQYRGTNNCGKYNVVLEVGVVNGKADGCTGRVRGPLGWESGVGDMMVRAFP